MPPVAAATGRSDIAICSNGAVSLNLGDGRITETRPMSAATVLESAERLRAVLPSVVFAVDTLDGYGCEHGYFSRQKPRECAAVGSLPAILDQGLAPLKLLCRPSSDCPAITADEMLKRARQVLGGIAEPVHSDPAVSLLEISALGVSKATTLARFAQSLGLSSEDVVAFGDMPNDIPMLRWAGRGYAMSGGHPDAIAAAAAVAPPCAEDGVAVVIERILAEHHLTRPSRRNPAR